ncbi:hypothetical protein AMR72_05820 [Flavobacterium psychrophilum]|nr:hypothetical protein AMR72_05820 [Flavobacterium psychrophilum]AOE52078.1 hypothetical protein ALW18_05815 [Flavobacterium psychrophilum]
MSDSIFLIFITCGLVLGYFGYRIMKSHIDKQNQRKEAEQLKNQDYQKVVKAREEQKLNQTKHFSVKVLNNAVAKMYFTSIIKQYQIVELIPEGVYSEGSQIINILFDAEEVGYITASYKNNLKEICEGGNYLAYITYIDWDYADPCFSFIHADITVEYKE